MPKNSDKVFAIFDEIRKKRRIERESSQQAEADQIIANWTEIPEDWELHTTQKDRLWSKSVLDDVFFSIPKHLPAITYELALNKMGYNTGFSNTRPKTPGEFERAKNIYHTRSVEEQKELERYKLSIISLIPETLEYLKKMGIYPVDFPRPNILPENMKNYEIREILEKFCPKIFRDFEKARNSISRQNRIEKAYEEVMGKCLDYIKHYDPDSFNGSIEIKIQKSELSESSYYWIKHKQVRENGMDVCFQPNQIIVILNDYRTLCAK